MYKQDAGNKYWQEANQNTQKRQSGTNKMRGRMGKSLSPPSGRGGPKLCIWKCVSPDSSPESLPEITETLPEILPGNLARNLAEINRTRARIVAELCARNCSATGVSRPKLCDALK